MKSKLYLLLFITISLGILSCKTASKLYEKGNYDAAVELAAKKLQKDPDDPKLLNILRESYRFAVNDHENRIRTHSESSNELKWEWLYNEYVSLQRMYEAIYRVPSVYDLVKPVNYSAYLQTYAAKAGDVRFDRGLAFMQRYDKKSYQSAYREFEAALLFKPGDRDAQQKLNEAYAYAVTNVVIVPLQQYGGYVYSNYAPGADNLDDQLIRRLQNSGGNEFVKFYSAWDARSRQVRTDQVVELHFDDIRIGRSNDYVTTRKVSKEVLVKETVIRPDSVIREYAKVFATIRHTRSTLASRATLELVVREENGRPAFTDRVNATHNWSTEFSTFTGDSRALSEADNQELARRPQPMPSEYDIMQCLVDQVSEESFRQLRNYFSRF